MALQKDRSSQKQSRSVAKCKASMACSPFRGLLSSKKFLRLSLWHGLIQHWAGRLLRGTKVAPAAEARFIQQGWVVITQLLRAPGHHQQPYFPNNPKICFILMWLWLLGWTFPTVGDFWNLNCFSSLIAPGMRSGISLLLMGKYLRAVMALKLLFLDLN